MSEALVVPPDSIGKRLDQFISQVRPDVSRSAVQKAIKRGDILVNSKNVTPHYQLNVKDQIALVKPLHSTKALIPSQHQTFIVINEDENFLVIDKPAGLLVHPNGENHDTTLANQLIAYYPPLATVGDDPIRPGIVHRLDREVSGVMVVAKTQTAFNHLKQQFQSRNITKEYRAVVYGVPTKTSGEITFSITRSKHQPSRMAARPDDSGKEAATLYEVLKSERNRSLLRVMTKTGRTHQVRVHLFALGHPVVGDQLYHPKKKDRHTPDRILLHASRLCFRDLTDVERFFESPLPGESGLWLPV